MVFVAAISITGAALLSGCGGSSGTAISPPNTVQSTGTFGSLQFTTTAPRISALGGSMTIAYKITNAGANSVTVNIPATFLDGKVMKGSSLIWQSSKVNGTLAGWAVVVLHPGDSQNGTLMWNQKDLNGVRVGPGTYTVKAWSPIGSVDGTAYTLDQAETNFSPTPVTVSIL